MDEYVDLAIRLAEPEYRAQFSARIRANVHRIWRDKVRTRRNRCRQQMSSTDVVNRCPTDANPRCPAWQVYVRDWQKFFERAVASVTFTAPLDLALPSTPRSQTQPYSHPAMRRRAAENTPRVITNASTTLTAAVKQSPQDKVGMQSKVLSAQPDVPSKVLKIKPRLVANPGVLKIVPRVDTNAKLLRQPRLVAPVVSGTVKPAFVPARVSDPRADALRLGVRAIELNNLGRLDESALLLRQAIALAPDAVSGRGGRAMLNRRSLVAIRGNQVHERWQVSLQSLVITFPLSFFTLAQLPQRLWSCAQKPMETAGSARGLS